MRGDRGSATVEFVLVGTLLTVVTAAILQVGIALYVRNIVHDAAVDGAYRAALADARPGDAEADVFSIVGRTVGRDVIQAVTVDRDVVAGDAVSVVTVSATLPIIGLIGVPDTMEVTAHAPLESFDVE